MKSSTRSEMKYFNLIQEVLNLVSGKNGIAEIDQIDYQWKEFEGQDDLVQRGRIDSKGVISVRGMHFLFSLTFDYAQPLNQKVGVMPGSTVWIGVAWRSCEADIQPYRFEGGSSEREIPGLEQVQRYITSHLAGCMSTGVRLEPRRLVVADR